MTGVTVGRSNYYTEVIARDDYYKEGGESPGRWYGKASERFALEDAEIGYKDKSLRNLMLGKDPHTQEQLRNVSLTSREYKTKDSVTGKETVERSDPKLAWDFTFSAPKSVSVLWSVADDETRRAIEAAQRTAVEAAVTAIEEKASYTRTGRGGVNQQSMEVAFAAFDHTTSRALDPHLHTHVLLLNTGIREDGKGGTIDARGIFQTGVHTFGAIYGNTLRYELEKLGIEMYERKLEKGKTYEVRGVPQALITESSKRHHEIRAAITEKEHELGRRLNSYENDSVFRKTRDTKKRVDKEALRLLWQEQGRAHGFDYTKFIGRERKEWTQEDQKTFLKNVTRSLSYKERIGDRELLQVALYHSKGKLSQEDVEKFINSYKSTHLFKLHVHEKYGQLYNLNGHGSKTGDFG